MQLKEVVACIMTKTFRESQKDKKGCVMWNVIRCCKLVYVLQREHMPDDIFLDFPNDMHNLKEIAQKGNLLEMGY